MDNELDELLPEAEEEDSKFVTMAKAVYNVMFLPVVFSVIAVVVFHCYDSFIETGLSELEASKPVYWLYTKTEEDAHLKHVINILDKLGYRRGNNESDWDLLWAHDYPFKTFPHLKAIGTSYFARFKII